MSRIVAAELKEEARCSGISSWRWTRCARPTCLRAARPRLAHGAARARSSFVVERVDRVAAAGTVDGRFALRGSPCRPADLMPGATPESSIATMNRADLVRDAARPRAESRRPHDWRDVIRGRVSIIACGPAAWVDRHPGLRLVRPAGRPARRPRGAHRRAGRRTEVGAGHARRRSSIGTAPRSPVSGARATSSSRTRRSLVKPRSEHGRVAKLCGVVERLRRHERARDASGLLRAKKQRGAVAVATGGPADAQRVSELDVRGLLLDRERRRFYPNRDLAAHVIGLVGDSTSAWRAWSRRRELTSAAAGIATGAARRSAARPTTAVEQPATMRGERRTDDRPRAAAHRRARTRRGASGEYGVRAVASSWTPGRARFSRSRVADVQPQRVHRVAMAYQRNRAVQDIYEPGSTMKLVTASSALDSGPRRPRRLFERRRRQYPHRIRVVHDMHAYSGSLSLRDVIVKSSNVGAISHRPRVGAEDRRVRAPLRLRRSRTCRIPRAAAPS